MSCLIYILPGETPIEGVNSENLVERVRKAGYRDVIYGKDTEGAIKNVIAAVKKGDIVLTLGAGNVWKIGEEILNRLRGKSEK